MGIFDRHETELVNFQLIRGWPSDGALEDIVKADAGAEFKRGDIVMLESVNGKGDKLVKRATTAGITAGKMIYFVFDIDQNAESYSVMKSGFMVRSSNTVGTDFAVNGYVTAEDGKFKSTTTAATAIGKVAQYNAVTGEVTVVWTKLD